MDSSAAAGGMPAEEGPQTFTAWDGTVFEELQSFMKYEMETRYTFKGETGESETRLPGEIEGQPFDLIDLDDCEVQLLDCTDRIKAQNVRNSKVFVGACSSQVIISHCRDCTFTLATREFYAHDTENCTFLLYCATPPEIEAATCHGLTFAPFNGRYEQLEENLAQAGLDPEENRWWDVLPIVASDSEASVDVAQDVTVPEGCYRLMPEEEYAASISPWEPLGDCKPCIPALWPAAPPSATGGNGGLQDEEEDDVRVITSPGQLFPSSSSSLSASGAQAQAAKQQPQQQQPPLPPSSSTNTLLPAPFSAPTTPFSSQEGTPSISGSASGSASGRPARAQSHQPPLASQPEHPSTAAHGAAREQRALSHQPTTTAVSSSNSLVGLAGAGLGGSAAPSPFNSTRGVGSASASASAAASPFNSSSGHRGAAALGSSSAGVEEKKDGALVSPVTAGGLQGQEGTTLADFDYERWHAAWEERLRTKAEKEERVAQAARAEAGRALDAFYDSTTDVKALRQERNREAEEATLAHIEASEAASDENPFKRVLELVGATDPGTGPDMSRFRGLMISLREEGLPCKPRGRRRLPTLGGGEEEEGKGRGYGDVIGASSSSLSSSSLRSSQVRP